MEWFCRTDPQKRISEAESVGDGARRGSADNSQAGWQTCSEVHGKHMEAVKLKDGGVFTSWGIIWELASWCFYTVIVGLRPLWAGEGLDSGIKGWKNEKVKEREFLLHQSSCVLWWFHIFCITRNRFSLQKRSNALSSLFCMTCNFNRQTSVTIRVRVWRMWCFRPEQLPCEEMLSVSANSSVSSYVTMSM